MNFKTNSIGIWKLWESVMYVFKLRTPRLNGKEGRSHRTDDVEFPQLLSYTADVDLNRQLSRWEKFYNFTRPHKSLKGQTPYEILREKLR